ncbi:MAG TPA: alpha/beta hydrolase [Rhizomicrobium sp.]
MRCIVASFVTVLALLTAAPVMAQLSSGYPELVQKHLVSVGGGRRMNIVCIGHGTPTVVFDYGLGSHMLHWQKIQRPISAITKACFYDRAGYGFSDPARMPMTADNVTNDLHDLLRNAGIAGPIVLVGHSLGGLYATLYADKFPSRVAGLVLIDPSFAGQDRVKLSAAEEQRERAEFASGQIQDKTCANLARAGKLTETTPHGCFQLMPERSRSEIAYLMQQFLKPFRYESVMSEAKNDTSFGMTDSEDGLEEEKAARSFGSRPVVVLTAGISSPDSDISKAHQKAFAENWKSGHDRLALRSTRGVSIVVPDSGHFIQLDRPQQVIDAIKRVVLEIRKSRAALPH